MLWAFALGRIEELCNLDLGLWQGLQVDEIKRRHLWVFRQWIEDPCTIRSAPRRSRSRGRWTGSSRAQAAASNGTSDEAIGLVACEPIAQFIACYLRRDPRVQLTDHVPTGGFEKITLGPDWGRNGVPN